MIRVVSTSLWRPDAFRDAGIRVIHHRGFMADALEAFTEPHALWAPGAWITSAEKRVGQRFPLVSPTMRDLPDLPTHLTGRSVEVLIPGKVNDWAWQQSGRWVKHPLRKVGGEEARLVHSLDEVWRALPSARTGVPVQVSEPLPGILAEWRVWVVDGAPATMCRYADALADGTLITDPGVWEQDGPEEVEAVAVAAVAALSSPPRSIVVDVAYTTGGVFVMEFNASWSSDWYGADLEKVAVAVGAAWDETHPSRWWSAVN